MRKYNKILANRIAEKLMNLADVEEKVMFGGIVFMVNGKMCIGVTNEDMMLRINPSALEYLDNKDGWKQMTMGSKQMNGYILVSEDVLNRNDELDFWINLALEFNPLAKASKSKR